MHPNPLLVASDIPHQYNLLKKVRAVVWNQSCYTKNLKFTDLMLLTKFWNPLASQRPQQ